MAETNRVQFVRSKPEKLFKEKYLTKKGQKLLSSGTLTKKQAWEKYGKNRYVTNPESVIIKSINHNQ